MKYDHERRPKPAKIKEPVQVYLSSVDRDRLERLTQQLDASKSDVLRQALGALERELADPASHPALRMIGLAGDPAGRPTPPDLGYDPAVEHDRFLADTEIESWDRSSDRED